LRTIYSAVVVVVVVKGEERSDRPAGKGGAPAGRSQRPESKLEAANRKNGTFRSLRTFHLAPVFILAVVGRLPVQRWKRKRVQTATSNLWEPNSRKSAAFGPANHRRCCCLIYHPVTVSI